MKKIDYPHPIPSCKCGCAVFVCEEDEGVAIVHPDTDRNCKSNNRYLGLATGKDKDTRNKAVDALVHAWSKFGDFGDNTLNLAQRLCAYTKGETK